MDYNEQQRIADMEAQEQIARDDSLQLQQMIEAEQAAVEQETQFIEQTQGLSGPEQPQQQPVQQQQEPEQEQSTESKDSGWDEAAYRRGEYDDKPYWDRIDDNGIQRPVSTSPFMDENGQLDLSKTAQTGGEFDRATLTSIADFAVDTLNFIPYQLGFGSPIPKIPKFENELAQSSRDIQGLMIPMVVGNAAALRGINAIPAVKNSAYLTSAAPKMVGTRLLETGVGATVSAISATSREDSVSGTLKQNYPRSFGWLPDFIATNENDSPDEKWRKNIVEGVFLDSTMGVIESGFALARKSSRNAEVMNWVPKNEQGDAWFDRNLPRASPEEARQYFMDVQIQKAGDEPFDSAYASAERKWKALSKADKKKYRVIANNNEPEIVSRKVSEGQNSQLDEIGQYNLERNVREVETEVPITSGRDYYIDEARKVNSELEGVNEFDFGKQFDELDDATKTGWDEAQVANRPVTRQMTRELNLDQPVFGVHDVYGYRESGVRQLDELGVVGASVDAARIQGQIGTYHGRLGNMLSDSAIKLSNDSGQMMVDDISRGLAGELKAAGQYGYVTNTGQAIDFPQIQEAGDFLASRLYNTSPEEMQEMLRPYFGKVSKGGVQALKTEGGQAIAKVLEQYRKDFLDPDLLRAQGLLSTSLSGQVADTAQGVRLMSGTEALERGTEQVLDRLEYLMNMKAQADATKASSIRLGNLWDQLNTWGPNASTNKEMRRALKQWKNTQIDDKNALASIKQNTHRTVETMRAISKQQPELMEPFLFAYEMTDGAINSMHSLNRFYNESTAVWKKALVDGASDIPSIYNKAWWSNVYNNMLSSFATPISAVKSGVVTGLARPIADGAGSIISGDQRAIRRGWYMYSSMIDTTANAADYMKRVWNKAGTDPNIPGQRVSSQTQNMKQVEIVRRVAKAKAAAGEPAAQIFVDSMDNMIDIAGDPNLRVSSRAMSAWDGFWESVVGQWEARGRAFTQLTDDAATDLRPDQMDALAKNIYGQMFDETGMMTDDAVKYASGELTFNLDSGYNDGLNKLIETLPILKGFTMFNKTMVGAMGYTASSNPLGLFINKVNKFELPYEQMDGAKVEQLLQERSIKFSNPMEARDEYTRLRNELKGRKAIGATAMTLAGGMFMNDRLRGDGLYDKQADAARREYDRSYENRTYKGWDGKWYSYDGLGAISDYIALTATIMDNGLFWANGKAALRNQDMNENIRAMGHVLGSTLTERSTYAQLEPLFDILRGDPGALTRWSGGFLNSATVPGANAVSQFNQVLDSSKRIVEQNVLAIAASRTPLNTTMPKRWNPIDGKAVGEQTNFWARIWNASRTWKVTGETSPNSEFISKVGFDMRPSIFSNGKGVKYSGEQQEEIMSLIGERGWFSSSIERIRKEVDSEKFRESFREAQRAGLNPDLATFGGVNKRLRQALNESVKLAEAELSSRDAITRQTTGNREINEALKRGDVDRATELQNFYKQ